MSERYKFRNPDGIYFVTPTLVGWIDVFTRKIYCELILDSLHYCQQHKGLVVHAWVIMPSHLHLIISRNGEAELWEIMRDFKKFTSKAIVNIAYEIPESRREWMIDQFKLAGEPLNRIKNYKVWRDGNHPKELKYDSMMNQKLNYLHNNPVVSGYVDEPHEWKWSSARDYAEMKGSLDIVKLE